MTQYSNCIASVSIIAGFWKVSDLLFSLNAVLFKCKKNPKLIFISEDWILFPEPGTWWAGPSREETCWSMAQTDSTLNSRYRPSLEKGSNQLIVTLYTLTIYLFVYNQLIRTLFKARIVVTVKIYKQKSTLFDFEGKSIMNSSMSPTCNI